MDLRVQKVQDIMRDNFQRKLSLGEIANSVNLSVWYLCHLFRTETGLSPIEFLRMLRMERARLTLGYMIRVTLCVTLRRDTVRILLFIEPLTCGLIETELRID